MRLPDGFAIRIADDVRSVGGGAVLVGGSPLVALHLSLEARTLIVNGALEVDAAPAALVGERLLSTNIGIPVLEGLPNAASIELTVVIPVRDRHEQLNRALAALHGLHVIVVDDASADAATVASVAKEHGADLIRLPRNVGPGAARNAGLRTAATPYIAFVDSDVVVATDTLLGLTSHFADPAVALVAPQVRSRAVNARPRWFERYDESAPALGLGERPGVVRPGAAVAWLPSACMVARTDRLVAGFDASMRVGEDVDLVWRLIDDGYRVRYDPTFTAHHDARPTLRAWMGRKFIYGTGGAALAERHPHNMVTAQMTAATATASTALLSFRPWSIPVAAVCTVRGFVSLVRTLPDVPGRNRLAARLSLRGLGWGLRQESALVLRHWWPAALTAALLSRRARRIVISAMIADVVATRIEKPELDPVITFAGRRLDDIAYGAGLWWGALRHRSLRCLQVRRSTHSRLVNPAPRTDQGGCGPLDGGRASV